VTAHGARSMPRVRVCGERWCHGPSANDPTRHPGPSSELNSRATGAAGHPGQRRRKRWWGATCFEARRGVTAEDVMIGHPPSPRRPRWPSRTARLYQEIQAGPTTSCPRPRISGPSEQEQDGSGLDISRESGATTSKTCFSSRGRAEVVRRGGLDSKHSIRAGIQRVRGRPGAAT